MEKNLDLITRQAWLYYSEAGCDRWIESIFSILIDGAGNTKGGASDVDSENLRHGQDVPPFFSSAIGCPSSDFEFWLAVRPVNPFESRNFLFLLGANVKRCSYEVTV